MQRVIFILAFIIVILVIASAISMFPAVASVDKRISIFVERMLFLILNCILLSGLCIVVLSRKK